MQVILRVQVVTRDAGYLKRQLITRGDGAGYCRVIGCDRGCRLSYWTAYNWRVQVIVRVLVATGGAGYRK